MLAMVTWSQRSLSILSTFSIIDSCRVQRFANIIIIISSTNFIATQVLQKLQETETSSEFNSHKRSVAVGRAMSSVRWFQRIWFRRRRLRARTCCESAVVRLSSRGLLLRYVTWCIIISWWPTSSLSISSRISSFSWYNCHHFHKVSQVIVSILHRPMRRTIGYFSHQTRSLGSKYTTNVFAAEPNRKRIVFVCRERFWWLKMWSICWHIDDSNCKSSEQTVAHSAIINAELSALWSARQ